MEDDILISEIETEDFCMSYAKIGNGNKNFLIIPGISIKKVATAAKAIAEQYSCFGEDFTIWLLDRRDNIKIGYTVFDMADDTARALDALNINDCYVLGASQGGIIAMILATNYPEKVKKAVIASSALKSSEYSADVFSRWAELADNKSERQLAEAFCRNVYSQNTVELCLESIINSNKNITDKEFFNVSVITKALFDFDIESCAKKIHCPILAVGSEGDKVFLPIGSYDIAKATGCEIYMYGAEYGHGVYDEAPDFAKRCYEFLTAI